MSNAEQTLGRRHGVARLAAAAAIFGLTSLAAIWGAGWWVAPPARDPPPPVPITAPTMIVPDLKPIPEPATQPSFDLVRVAPDGLAVIAGRAGENVEILVRDGDREIGHTRADEHGQWVLLPNLPLAPGTHDIILVTRAQPGETTSGEVPESDASVRLVIPAQATASATPAAAPAQIASAPPTRAGNHLVVQPGQTLWRIARDSYGEGTRYTVIFEANRDHITDPSRIYPGQTFAIPAPTPAR